MTHRKLLAGMIASLLLGCGGYKNAPTYTKTDPSVATSEAAPVRSAESSSIPGSSSTQVFTNDDINGMVAEADDTAAAENDDDKALAEVMIPEPDEVAFASSDMAAEIDASFAKNQNGKNMGPIKTLVKNLAAAAKNGKVKRTKNIAVQLLKLIVKKADQGQAKAKDLKVKVSDLVKKIVEAANKNKKNDLKKSVEDLIKLLN